MNSPYKNKTGFTRILSAFKNSAYGLKNTFKNEKELIKIFEDTKKLNIHFS